MFQENLRLLVNRKSGAIFFTTAPRETEQGSSTEVKTEGRAPTYYNLLMYEGVADSGTTRLLSEVISIAESNERVVVTDFTLTSNDISRLLPLTFSSASY